MGYDANKSYDMTIVVLSNQSQPVKGALVTVLGPIAFTNQRTNKDGRVIYPYTGRDDFSSNVMP